MKWYQVTREFIRARILGMTALLVILTPLALTGIGGFFLDRWLGTMPLFTILLLLLGLAAATKGALKFKP
jgi:Putative F0F1-ATPase subunit Ca2+/Mg2+ transporter